MHSDPRQWHPAPGASDLPERCPTLDWQGLRARLEAASDARMAMVHAANFASSRNNGSFDAGSARLLEAFARPVGRDESTPGYDYPRSISGVNRVDSGRGKSRSAISGDTAGIDSAGDRGLK